jgi:serine/threonine-protein kinase
MAKYRLTPWTVRAVTVRRKYEEVLAFVRSALVVIIGSMSHIENEHPLPFTLAGRYECVSQIGFGGMGAVYRAKDTNLDRDVAVKLLRNLSDEEQHHDLNKERFRLEALALSRLRHPNTVQVTDFGHAEDGLPFIVTELLEGRSIEELINDEGAVAPKRVVHIISQICMSLSEAHGAGIVHRDLKPSNIFLIDVVGAPEFVKVIDFGVARLLQNESDLKRPLTAEGTTLGTPDYMAPEQARGLTPSPATDVYALGCLMYQMLTGKLPFTGNTPLQVMIQHVKHHPAPLQEAKPELELPPGLEAILLKCMEKSAEDRPSDAGELLSRLRSLPITLESDAVGKDEAEASVKPTGKRVNQGSTILMAAVDEENKAPSKGMPVWAWPVIAAVLAAAIYWLSK